jgi:hypothetical protein
MRAFKRAVATLRASVLALVIIACALALFSKSTNSFAVIEQL